MGTQNGALMRWAKMLISTISAKRCLFFRFESDNTNEESDTANSDRIYCYLVEQCLQAAQNNRVIFCPVHANMGPFFVASADGRVTSAHAAPDAVRSSMMFINHKNTATMGLNVSGVRAMKTSRHLTWGAH